MKLFHSFNPDGRTATTGQIQMQHASPCDLHLTYRHSVWIGLVISIRAVFIDDGAIGAVGIKEVEWQFDPS